MRMRSRRWTGSSGTVVERRSSTVGGSLRTAMLADVRRGESSIGAPDATVRRTVPDEPDLRSVLSADELIEDAHALSLGDRYIPWSIGAAADLDKVARPREEGANLGGSIREEIPRIVVTLHAVQASAAIGVDQAGEELSWVQQDRSFLPGLKPDRPCVLWACAVLWKQADPVLPVAVELDASRASNFPTPRAATPLIADLTRAMIPGYFVSRLICRQTFRGASESIPSPR